MSKPQHGFSALLDWWKSVPGAKTVHAAIHGPEKPSPRTKQKPSPPPGNRTATN
jgi:hypothetical protein